MKTILIIDDRQERKKTFLSDTEIKELDSITEIKNHLELDCIETIKKNLNPYDIIAIHRSWLQNQGDENEIKKYAEENAKHLILFSGGIDQKLMTNDFTAQVNSADFYNSRLIDFIKKYKSGNLNNPLLYFLYGESWRLSLWIELRSIYWKSNNEIDESNETIIDNLLTMLQETSSPEDWDVKKITQRINNEKYI